MSIVLCMPLAAVVPLVGQPLEATGFIRTQEIDGLWWLVDANGERFVSKGVNHISYAADHCPALGYAPYGRATHARYGSAEAWARATADRLRGWGFNTIGAWSSSEMYGQGLAYTVNVDLVASAGADWQHGGYPDVFADGFAEVLRRRAAQMCAPHREDPLLLGYFTDNELRWGPDWRSADTLLATFFSLPEAAPGKAAAVAAVAERYADIDTLNQAWGSKLASLDDLRRLEKLTDASPAMSAALFEVSLIRGRSSFGPGAVQWCIQTAYGNVEALNERCGTHFASFADAVAEREPSPLVADLAAAEQAFLRHVAETYFRTCADAIRAHDPNHLILGCRFAGYAPAEVYQAMAEWVDAVSFNNYDVRPPVAVLEAIHRQVGKPVLLTEFGFKAADSGLPNTRGAGSPVATQQDRASCFETYVTELLKLPFAVGFHWFEYADEPAEGRFDGENSNYGLVNIQDDPWETLTERMAEVNARLDEVHAGAR